LVNIIFIDIQIFFVQKNLTTILIFFICFPFPSPFWWIGKPHFNHCGKAHKSKYIAELHATQVTCSPTTLILCTKLLFDQPKNILNSANHEVCHRPKSSRPPMCSPLKAKNKNIF